MNPISFPIDIKNPGHYFACCGILEASNRIFDNVKGCFVNNRFELYTNNDNPLSTILIKIIDSKNDQSEIIRNDGKKDKKLVKNKIYDELIKNDNDESASPILLTNLEMRLDFWKNFDNRNEIKLFAGQEKSNKLILRWLVHLNDNKDNPKLLPDPDLDPFAIQTYDLPSGFDTSASSNALDVGYSLEALPVKPDIMAYPIVEFFAYLGAQSYGWSRVIHKDKYYIRYCVWETPFSVPVTRAIGSGMIKLPNTQCFESKLERNGQKKILKRAKKIQY